MLKYFNVYNHHTQQPVLGNVMGHSTHTLAKEASADIPTYRGTICVDMDSNPPWANLYIDYDLNIHALGFARFNSEDKAVEHRAADLPNKNYKWVCPLRA